MESRVTGNLQSGTDQNAGWVSGRVAGQIEGAWWTQVIHDTAPDSSGQWRIARQPERPGNSGRSFLAVPKTSKDPAAAVAFAQWITSPEVQSRTYNDIQLFPSTPASFTNGLMQKPGDFFGDQDPLDFFSDTAMDVPVTNGGSVGGPDEAGMTIVLYQYDHAFNQFDFGYGSAIAWVLFIFSVVFAIINWRLLSERDGLKTPRRLRAPRRVRTTATTTTGVDA